MAAPFGLRFATNDPTPFVNRPHNSVTVTQIVQESTGWPIRDQISIHSNHGCREDQSSEATYEEEEEEEEESSTGTKSTISEEMTIISSNLGGFMKDKFVHQNMNKHHNCPRGHWRPSEDDKLREIVAEYGPQNWNLIAEKLQGRSGFSFLYPRTHARTKRTHRHN